MVFGTCCIALSLCFSVESKWSWPLRIIGSNRCALSTHGSACDQCHWQISWCFLEPTRQRRRHPHHQLHRPDACHPSIHLHRCRADTGAKGDLDRSGARQPVHGADHCCQCWRSKPATELPGTNLSAENTEWVDSWFRTCLLTLFSLKEHFKLGLLIPWYD